MRRHIEATWGWDETWQRNDFQERFTRYAVSVIENVEQPVGSIWLKEMPQVVFIADIQIVPDYQRRGIGTAVLREVIAQAAAIQRDVELVVLPTNDDARRLYERIGFQVTKREAPFVYMRYRRVSDPN